MVLTRKLTRALGARAGDAVLRGDAYDVEIVGVVVRAEPQSGYVQFFKSQASTDGSATFLGVMTFVGPIVINWRG